MALDVLHEEANPLRPKISLTKAKVPAREGLVDDSVRSFSACGEDVEVV